MTIENNTKGHNSTDNDEAYWEMLLSEGEFTYTAIDDSLNIDVDEPPHHEHESYLADTNVQDWDEISAKMDNDDVLSLKVVGYNRGGLLVEWHTLKGFVPSSQLTRFPTSETTDHKRQALIDRVGDTLHLRVIELDPIKNRFILSERAAQVERGSRDKVLHALHRGDIIEGSVTNLCDFGAFVDLGGVEGLIHISELSWGRVGHPSDVLKRNQTVRVYVLDIDIQDMRIALSLKRLHPDPWETVETRYTVGQIVEGEITNVVDFGAFACIEEGLEGLIHFSELAEGQFLHPRNVVSEGDTVEARILTIDGRARRLGLSLRLK